MCSCLLNRQGLVTYVTGRVCFGSVEVHVAHDFALLLIIFPFIAQGLRVRKPIMLVAGLTANFASRAYDVLASHPQ